MITLTIMMILFMMIMMLLILFNIMISNKINNNREKNSPFECGFDPLSSPRLPFSMQFYLISIIFLIFDIEIIIFIPIIPSILFNKIYHWSMIMIFFISILFLGLYIEWNDGALKWLK